MRTMLWLWAGVLAAGAAQAQYRHSVPWPSTTAIPSVGEAPPYLKYMSPRCASLHDSIRTGPARGLNADTMNAARKEYNNECREDEQEASQRYYRDKQDTRMEKRREQQAQGVQVERAKLQSQQCEESKRILRMKKARTDLTEGEKSDLQRFEDNYKARCT